MKLSNGRLFIGLGVLLLLFPLLIAGCGPQAQTPGTVSSPGPTANPIAKNYAEFEVGGLSVVRSGVSVGEIATVSTSIINTGGVAGTYKAVLTVNGQQAGEKDVSVPADASVPVSFQISENQPGTYEVDIDGATSTLGVYTWPYTIKYDLNNVYGESLSLSNDYGHIVHFTPPAVPFKIQKIDVYVQAFVDKDTEWDSRFVTVRIWNSARTEQLWTTNLPWRDFRQDVVSFWKEIAVPNVSAAGDFYVEMVTHSNEFQGEMSAWNWGPEVRPAIFVGYDRPNPYQTKAVSSVETRSGISENAQLIEVPIKYQGMNWLIRVTGDGSL